MTSDIWNDETISRLMGRYVSYTGCSGNLRYKGVLIAVEYVTKTLTLAEKSLASNTGITEHVTGGYERRIAIQTVTWAQGDDVKIVDLYSSDDKLDEIITEKNVITTEILNYRKKSLQFEDNLLQQLVQPSKKSNSKNCNCNKQYLCEHEHDTTTIT